MALSPEEWQRRRRGMEGGPRGRMRGSYYERQLGEGQMGDVALYEDILPMRDVAVTGGDVDRVAELERALGQAPTRAGGFDPRTRYPVGHMPSAVTRAPMPIIDPSLPEPAGALDLSPRGPSTYDALFDTAGTLGAVIAQEFGMSEYETGVRSGKYYAPPEEEERILKDPESLKVASNINKALETFGAAWDARGGSFATRLAEANQKTRELYPDMPNWFYTVMGILAEEGVLLLLSGGGSMLGTLAKGTAKL